MSKKFSAFVLVALSSLLLGSAAQAATTTAHGHGGHGHGRPVPPPPPPNPPPTPIPLPVIKPQPNLLGFFWPYVCANDGDQSNDLATASFVNGNSGSGTPNGTKRSFLVNAFVSECDTGGGEVAKGDEAAGAVWNGLVNQPFTSLDMDYTSQDNTKFWVGFFGFTDQQVPVGPIYIEETVFGPFSTVNPAPPAGNGMNHIQFTSANFPTLAPLANINMFLTATYDFPAPNCGTGNTSGNFLLNAGPGQFSPTPGTATIGCPDRSIGYTTGP